MKDSRCRNKKFKDVEINQFYFEELGLESIEQFEFAIIFIRVISEIPRFFGSEFRAE